MRSRQEVQDFLATWDSCGRSFTEIRRTLLRDRQDTHQRTQQMEGRWLTAHRIKKEEGKAAGETYVRNARESGLFKEDKLRGTTVYYYMEELFLESFATTRRVLQQEMQESGTLPTDLGNIVPAALQTAPAALQDGGMVPAALQDGGMDQDPEDHETQEQTPSGTAGEAEDEDGDDTAATALVRVLKAVLADRRLVLKGKTGRLLNLLRKRLLKS